MRMDGEDATMDKWSANTELAKLIEDETKAEVDYPQLVAKFNARFNNAASQVLAYSQGARVFTAEVIYRRLHKAVLKY